MNFTKEFYITLIVLIGCISGIITLWIIKKSKLTLNIDGKNKKVEILNKNENYAGEHVLISKDLFEKIILEVERIATELQEIKKEILSRQMTHVKRQIKIHINSVLQKVVQELGIEENSPTYKIFYLYYLKAEALLIDKTREILKRNHIIEESLGDWQDYKNNTQKYIFQTVENYAMNNFHEDVMKMKRRDYNKKCKNMIMSMHKETFFDIFEESLKIVKGYSKKIETRKNRLDTIRSANKEHL